MAISGSISVSRSVSRGTGCPVSRALPAAAGGLADGTFLSWRTRLPPVRVDSNVDGPSMVYEHAVLCEYAHARLRQLGDGTGR